ncbi:uncharacterized protein LOC108699596 isoform X1 [Xenopus laevis]|uniref:Uncharacterized protein LOC108699596 isoform X1 n=2 Tax=Xenopus laevis TaxID=8355 RepID=A0A8J1LJ32_XENLA|nr:uncharacterized protein LOC108699596 isoform X1 [Xenopus laevis]
MYLNITNTMYHHLFIIIIGLFTLFMNTTSAVTVENFTLFKEKLTLKAHTINVIPCMFQTLKPLNPLRFQLEWGKMDTKGYTRLIHLHGDRVTVASPDLKDKYYIFESQVANGICSLVINPTEMTDSGTYQVRLKIVGKLYEPVPSIDIQVKNQDTDSRGLLDKTTVPPTTIASTAAATVSFEDEILQYINSSAKRETTTSIILGMLLVVGVIGLLIAVQQCMNRRQKNPAGDEENPSSDEENSSSDEKKPPVKTSKKGKDKKKKKKKREKSKSEKSSDESEESASSKSEESEESASSKSEESESD